MTDRHPPEPDRDCRRCPRLAAYRVENRRRFPDFHNAPVPATGSGRPALLIVGLAPGLEGANQTGIPFVGDAGAGAFLRAGLERAGLDGAVPIRLTNAVRCVPPANRPLRAEIERCAPFLEAELTATRPRVVLALGAVAHEAVLRVVAARPRDYPFRHGAHHAPGPFLLFDSYHTSRQNTQTGRLTPAMFDDLLARVRQACLAPAPA